MRQLATLPSQFNDPLNVALGFYFLYIYVYHHNNTVNLWEPLVHTILDKCQFFQTGKYSLNIFWEYTFWSKHNPNNMRYSDKALFH